VQWVDKVGGISAVLGRYRAVMGWVVLGAYALVFLVLLPRYRGRTWRVLAPTAAASVLTLPARLRRPEPAAVPRAGADAAAGRGRRLRHLHAGRSAARRRRAMARGRPVRRQHLLSFGLLALSGTPALRAFGLTMLLGTALVWLAAPCFTVTKEERHARPSLPDLSAGVVAALLLAGCARAPKKEAPARLGLRLAPAALGAAISVQQHLTVQRPGGTNDLDVALEVDAATWAWSAWRSASAC
jgi:hypothetical protein